MEEIKLKVARLLEQMNTYLATDAGKEIADKVGFVYQKMGVDKGIFFVDLKKGTVSTVPNSPRLKRGSPRIRRAEVRKQGSFLLLPACCR